MSSANRVRNLLCDQARNAFLAVGHLKKRLVYVMHYPPDPGYSRFAARHCRDPTNANPTVVQVFAPTAVIFAP